MLSGSTCVSPCFLSVPEWFVVVDNPVVNLSLTHEHLPLHHSHDGLVERTCCRLVSYQGRLELSWPGRYQVCLSGVRVARINCRLRCFPFTCNLHLHLPPRSYSVHEQINFGPAQQKWGKDEERINKFVFIGKGLDRAELTKGLQECLYKGDDGKK